MSKPIFSEENTSKLYITYKQHPENYAKIKQKLVGEDANIRFKRTKKSMRFFFAALTFIIIVSSAFSIVGDQQNSLIALWIIWAISLFFFLLVNYYNYQFNFKSQARRKHFFDHFEQIAQKSDSLGFFLEQWGSINYD